MSKQARSSGVNAGKVYNEYSDDFRRDAVAMIESEGLTAAQETSLSVNTMMVPE
jgi:hypothetical protein